MQNNQIFFVNRENQNQIKYLYESGKVERIYRGIYIAKGISIDTIMKVYFLDIITYIFWKSVLSASTAISFWPNGKHFFLRTKKQRIVEIWGYVFVANVFLPKEFNWEYRKITDNIGFPSKEVALLEAFVENTKYKERRVKNYKEYISANLKNLDFQKIENLSKAYKWFQKSAQFIFQVIWELKGTRKIKQLDKYTEIIQSGLDIDNKTIDMLKGLKTSLLGFSLWNKYSLINFLNKEQLTNYCFWESYFSNYIEGSKFLVSEAQEIISSWKVDVRPKDSHYVLDNFNFIVKFYKNIFTKPKDFLRALENDDAFIKLIKYIHKNITNVSLWEKAWVFKTQANMAWKHVFVRPEKVEGTLRYAFEMSKDLSWAAKAIFLKIAFLECHPFDDGNGRTSRILMNSILLGHLKNPILITNRLRDNYIDAIRAISNYWEFNKFKDLITLAYDETSTIDFNEPIDKSSLNESIESYEDRYAKYMQWEDFFF